MNTENMQTSGIKIDINSENLLTANSEKIQEVIKFAIKQAVKIQSKKIKPSKAKKTNK